MLFVVFMIGCALLCSHFAVAQSDSPAQDASSGKGIFKREKDKQEWQKQVEGVDYAKDKDIKLSYGDVLATKEDTLVFHFANYQIWIQPFSVFRLNSIAAGDDVTAVVPELLFGEALYKGDKGLVLLPGQSLEAQGTAYIVVDEEKYTIIASVDAQQKILPHGSDQAVTVSPAFMVDLGPSGETGEPFDMFEDDVAYYSEMPIPDDAPRVSVNTNQKVLTLEALNEYWTQTRVSLLQNGPESDVGLAISRGEHRQATQPPTGDNIQVFDPTKGPTQKTMSFSTSVGSTDSSAVIEGAPALTSISIGGVKASIGELLNLTFKNLEDGTIKIVGRATADNPEKWKLVLKINDDETLLESVTSFDYSLRVVQEFPNAPTLYNITIADQPAESFEEGTVLTRENLESGRIKIAGSAAAGQNILNYKIELVARDNEDKEQNIGTFQVDLDLSTLESVEISKDNGISWEAVSGLEEWTNTISPTDGEVYKVRARAQDVMGNKSEEQFDAYEFTYRYKTDNETLREVFESMMRAFLDEDRTTFLRNTSNDYSSNIEDLRDLNELESSIEERFRCCTVSIQYTIQDVYANMQAKTGSVEFYWNDKTGVSRVTNYAVFNFLYEEGAWKFSEVIDPNTFLRASRVAFSVELEIGATELNADGAETTSLRARVLDNAGSIVADYVEVVFTIDNGSASPSTALTIDGYANATYIAGVTPGIATITATSGTAVDSGTITLNPVAPPLPPDQEP